MTRGKDVLYKVTKCNFCAKVSVRVRIDRVAKNTNSMNIFLQVYEPNGAGGGLIDA
jgi:hypothetical protein